MLCGAICSTGELPYARGANVADIANVVGVVGVATYAHESGVGEIVYDLGGAGAGCSSTAGITVVAGPLYRSYTAYIVII
jgi:hypothetical protein